MMCLTIALISFRLFVSLDDYALHDHDLVFDHVTDGRVNELMSQPGHLKRVIRCLIGLSGPMALLG